MKSVTRAPERLISAVHGAEAIQSSGLPLTAVLGLIVLFTAFLNLFIGSASAKWALLAPVLVPMLMLLGISPEGATAAYRVQVLGNLLQRFWLESQGQAHTNLESFSLAPVTEQGETA